MINFKNMTVEELRAHAVDNDISYRDEDNKPLRRADLITRLDLELSPLEPNDPGEELSPATDPDLAVVAAPPAPTDVVAGGALADQGGVDDAEFEGGFFVVTEDLPYCVQGFLTTLSKGSVVHRDSHDLDEMRRQGAKLAPSSAFSIGYDDYGRPIMPGGQEFGAARSTTREVMPPELDLRGQPGGQTFIVHSDGRREILPEAVVDEGAPVGVMID